MTDNRATDRTPAIHDKAADEIRFTCERGVLSDAGPDLEKIEALWGPPPWELTLARLYPPEVMEHVTAITVDGVRFERKEGAIG